MKLNHLFCAYNYIFRLSAAVDFGINSKMPPLDKNDFFGKLVEGKVVDFVNDVIGGAVMGSPDLQTLATQELGSTMGEFGGEFLPDTEKGGEHQSSKELYKNGTKQSSSYVESQAHAKGVGSRKSYIPSTPDTESETSSKKYHASVNNTSNKPVTSTNRGMVKGMDDATEDNLIQTKGNKWEFKWVDNVLKNNRSFGNYINSYSFSSNNTHSLMSYLSPIGKLLIGEGLIKTKIQWIRAKGAFKEFYNTTVDLVNLGTKYSFLMQSIHWSNPNTYNTLLKDTRIPRFSITGGEKVGAYEFDAISSGLGVAGLAGGTIKVLALGGEWISSLEGLSTGEKLLTAGKSIETGIKDAFSYAKSKLGFFAKGKTKLTSSPYDLNPTEPLSRNRRQFRKFLSSVKKNGITESIKYVEHKGERYVVDGHHRLRAAKILGVKQVPIEKVSLPYQGYKEIIDLLMYFGR